MLYQLSSSNNAVSYLDTLMGHRGKAFSDDRIPTESKSEDNVYGSGRRRWRQTIVSQGSSTELLELVLILHSRGCFHIASKWPQEIGNASFATVSNGKRN
jgi:hypothetical protein